MERNSIHLGRRLAAVALVIAAALIPSRGAARAGQVVDRVVGRVEGDFLLLSDLRELGQFQKLIGGEPQPESKRMEELIDQWLIEREAKGARLDEPTDAEVNAALQQLQRGLGGEAAFAARLAEAGLTNTAVRRLLRREIFYSRYLDYKFRPAVQVDEAAEQKYYDSEFLPAVAARGEKAPPLDSVRGQVHELLVQKDITVRSEQWLTESRTRLKVEIVSPTAGGKGGGQVPEKETPR